jgi:SOS response regulatory protein OraA/RecX
MADRLKLRREGKFDDVGYYERYAQYSDKDWQRNMYERNNAIEEMYRRGYDMGQINDYLAGKRNVLEEGPSWQDYYAEKEAAGGGPNWTDGYFIGAPDQNRAGYASMRISKALQGAQERISRALAERGITTPQAEPAQEPQENRKVTRGLFGKYINKGQEQ